MTVDCLDLFSGAGGFAEGLRTVAPGMTTVGLEWDHHACRTSAANGHPVIRCDVTQYPTAPFRGVTLLVGGPSCQTFSMGGKGEGRRHIESIKTAAGRVLAGQSPDEALAEVRDDILDERTLMVLQPLRFIRDLLPETVVLEQVRPVLPIWEAYAALLRPLGYDTWCGVLSAEEYGVPQTRERAFLVASRVRAVGRPAATHRAYKRGGARSGQLALGDGLLPCAGVADALGWDARDLLRSPQSIAGGERALRAASEPSVTVTTNFDRALRIRAQRRDSGPGAERRPRPVTAPSYTIRANGSGSAPSGVEWLDVEGNAERVTVEEAAALQSFQPGYRFCGAKADRHRQVGNAAPPLLAAHVLAAALGVAAPAGLRGAA